MIRMLQQILDAPKSIRWSADEFAESVPAAARAAVAISGDDLFPRFFDQDDAVGAPLTSRLPPLRAPFPVTWVEADVTFAPEGGSWSRASAWSHESYAILYHENTATSCVASLFARNSEYGMFGPVVSVLVPLDKHGHWDTSRGDPGAIRFKQHIQGDSDRRSLTVLMEATIGLLFCVGFLNCSNVGTIEAPAAGSRAELRRRDREGLPPLVKFKTVVVRPHLSKSSKPGDGSGRQTAMHVCRGHFRRYTPEKPLFGKVVGTFWVQAHVRGTAERGVVVHDYKVEEER